MSPRFALLQYQSKEIVLLNFVISGFFGLAWLMISLLGTAMDWNSSKLLSLSFGIFKTVTGLSLLSIGFVFSWFLYLSWRSFEAQLYQNHGLSLTHRIMVSWAITLIPALFLLMVPGGLEP